MEIETGGPEVGAARRSAVELLLSDHVGDCEAPCRRGCPAGVDVPLLIRQVGAGAWSAAARTLKERVALPASLSHICSVPCEHACRRGRHDGPVAICLLERAVADADLRDPWVPPAAPASGKRVAIAGAGPAGLTAAYFLQQRGHACTLLEREGQPGGTLRGGVAGRGAPGHLLMAEIAVIGALGARVDVGRAVGRDVSLEELTADFDAVLLATGAAPGGDSGLFGRARDIEATAEGIRVAAGTFATGRRGVFAAGSSVRPLRHAAAAAAQGRAAALSLDGYLARGESVAERRPFSSIVGSLQDGEMEEFLAGSDPAPSVVPAAGHGAGYTVDDAVRETRRCLRCDCRRKDSCGLREAADRVGAVQRRFAGRERRRLRIVREHPEVLFEPEKCIRCGSCVQAAARAGEALGLALLGRGFEAHVGAPFGESLAAALAVAGRECAMVCPTGAIALRP
jgi:ferredoxin